MIENKNPALIMQTAKEKVLEKLQYFQMNHLTAKQQEELDKYKFYFNLNFIRLTYSFLGLSREQLKDFSKDELKELEKIITRKARSWAACQMFFTFCVPYVGWLVGSLSFWGNDFLSWKYLLYRRRLKKILGENYFSLLYEKGGI